MPSAVVEGLACEYCSHEPFKTKAALGSHTSAKHGKTLDGHDAPPRKGRAARRNGVDYQAVLQLGRRTITVTLKEAEIRKLLSAHPEAMLDAMLPAA